MARKTPKKTARFNAPFLLIAVGVVLLLLGTAYHIQQSKHLSFEGSYKTKQTHTTNNIPKNIVIRSIQISLPIKETTIKRGVWEIFNDGASHLSTSGNPDENQPIIIYAHNRTSQFGNINKLKRGDAIVLSNGINQYLYTVDHMTIVDPSNIKALNNIKGETLILYTCTGFADSKRFLVYANRVE